MTKERSSPMRPSGGAKTLKQAILEKGDAFPAAADTPPPGVREGDPASEGESNG